MLEKLKKWWNGEWVTYEFGIGLDRHWTSNVAHKLLKFYMDHWKFIWGSLVAIFCASLKFL